VINLKRWFYNRHPKRESFSSIILMDKSKVTISSVLIADDQADVREALRLLLKGEGFRTETVSSPAKVLSALERNDFDVLLIDMNYTQDTTSGQEGLDLLERLREYDDSLPIVVMTAWANIELAVEAMRRAPGTSFKAMG